MYNVINSNNVGLLECYVHRTAMCGHFEFALIIMNCNDHMGSHKPVFISSILASPCKG
jgi:hypothetical protein